MESRKTRGKRKKARVPTRNEKNAVQFSELLENTGTTKNTNGAEMRMFLKKTTRWKTLNDRIKKHGQNGLDNAYKREKVPFLTLLW